MTKITIVLLFLTFSFGQIFNTGKVLRKGDLSFGSHGTIFTNPSDFQLNLFGGYGLSDGIDLQVKFGFLLGDSYFGLDIEKTLMNSRSSDFSVAAGFHTQNDFGLDLQAVYSTKLSNSSNIFAGIDNDIEFAGDGSFNPWLVLGLDITTNRKMKFMFEADLPLKDGLQNKLAVGIHYFL